MGVRGKWLLAGWSSFLYDTLGAANLWTGPSPGHTREGDEVRGEPQRVELGHAVPEAVEEQLLADGQRGADVLVLGAGSAVGRRAGHGGKALDVGGGGAGRTPFPNRDGGVGPLISTRKRPRGKNFSPEPTGSKGTCETKNFLGEFKKNVAFACCI